MIMSSNHFYWLLIKNYWILLVNQGRAPEIIVTGANHGGKQVGLGVSVSVSNSPHEVHSEHTVSAQWQGKVGQKCTNIQFIPKIKSLQHLNHQIITQVIRLNTANTGCLNRKKMVSS